MKPFRHVGLQKAFSAQSEWKLWIGIIHIDYQKSGQTDTNTSLFSYQLLVLKSWLGFWRFRTLEFSTGIVYKFLLFSELILGLCKFIYIKWLEFKGGAGLLHEFCEWWQKWRAVWFPNCKIGCLLRKSGNWKYKTFVLYL